MVPYRRAAASPTMHAHSQEAPMKLSVPLLLAAGALLTGCQSTPPTPEQRADQCRLFRGYLSTQEPQYVQEACIKQMGEAACRECLSR